MAKTGLLPITKNDRLSTCAAVMVRAKELAEEEVYYTIRERIHAMCPSFFEHYQDGDRCVAVVPEGMISAVVDVLQNASELSVPVQIQVLDVFVA